MPNGNCVIKKPKCTMSRFILTSITISILFFTPLLIQAQKISKVRFDLKEKLIEINYDVSGINLKDSVYIEVTGKKSGKIKPIALSGDLGVGIQAGSNKKIVWDFMADNLRINEDIMVNVYLKKYQAPVVAVVKPTPKIKEEKPVIATKEKKEGEGLKSNPRKINKKALLTLAAGVVVGGALGGYGFQQKSLADQYYNDYKNNNWNQKITVDTDEFLKLYSEASIKKANEDLVKAQNQLKTANIFMYAGIGIVLADAIFSVPRLRQKKSPRKISYQIDFPRSNTVALGINIKF